MRPGDTAVLISSETAIIINTAGQVHFVRRNNVIVVHGIADQPAADLFDVALADCTFCHAARLVQRRQKHRRKNRDDRNHDQELDQGENHCFHP